MTTPDKIALNPKNTQIFTLLGLTDEETGLLVNSATLSCTLVDSQWQPVPGATGLVMSPVGSPPAGNYAALIPGSGFDPPIGGDYTFLVDGNDGVTVLHVETAIEIEAREE